MQKGAHLQAIEFAIYVSTCEGFSSATEEVSVWQALVLLPGIDSFTGSDSSETSQRRSDFQDPFTHYTHTDTLFSWHCTALLTVHYTTRRHGRATQCCTVR